MALGHRRIAIITSSHTGPYGVLGTPIPPDAGRVNSERMRGWLAALAPAGITPTVVRQPTYSPDPEPR